MHLRAWASQRPKELGQILHRCLSLSICRAVGAPLGSSFPQPHLKPAVPGPPRAAGPSLLWLQTQALLAPGPAWLWKGWHAGQVIGSHRGQQRSMSSGVSAAWLCLFPLPEETSYTFRIAPSHVQASLMTLSSTRYF